MIAQRLVQAWPPISYRYRNARLAPIEAAQALSEIRKEEEVGP